MRDIKWQEGVWATSDYVPAWRLSAGSGREKSKNGKPELSRYLHENPKAGDFNPRRTLSGMLVVIPERLASIRAIVLLCLRSALC